MLPSVSVKGGRLPRSKHIIAPKVPGRGRGRPPRPPVGTLGIALREARTRRGWGLVEAADRIGITFAKLSRYERALVVPTSSTLDKIRLVFTDLDQIIEDTKMFWL